MPRDGLAGDQDVIGADCRPPLGQKRPDFAGQSGVFLVELNHRELQRIDQREVMARAAALEYTVEKLVSDDSLDRDVAGVLLPHAEQSGKGCPSAAR